MYLEVTSGAVLHRPRMARNARIPHKLPSAYELHSHTFGSEATVSLPLTGEVARNARRRGRFPTNVRPRTNSLAGGQCTFFFIKKKKVPKKKLTSMLLDRFCDRQLCRPKPLFSKYAVFFSIPTPPKSNKF